MKVAEYAALSFNNLIKVMYISSNLIDLRLGIIVWDAYNSLVPKIHSGFKDAD